MLLRNSGLPVTLQQSHTSNSDGLNWKIPNALKLLQRHRNGSVQEEGGKPRPEVLQVCYLLKVPKSSIFHKENTGSLTLCLKL